MTPRLIYNTAAAVLALAATGFWIVAAPWPAAITTAAAIGFWLLGDTERHRRRDRVAELTGPAEVVRDPLGTGYRVDCPTCGDLGYHRLKPDALRNAAEHNAAHQRFPLVNLPGTDPELAERLIRAPVCSLCSGPLNPDGSCAASCAGVGDA